MRFTKKIYLLYLFAWLTYTSYTQIHHWETAVFAEDEWQYRLGNSPYPSNWMNPNFDDSSWFTGNGGFGYGDGDDGTTISPLPSVAMRIRFNITDLAAIETLVLSADYDDGFVAYLNGIAFARANIGNEALPDYNAGTPTDHEADLYQGLQPEYFANQQPSSLLVEGENILAIQVNNVSSTSSDLSSNFYLSLGINNVVFDYAPPPPWFEPPVTFSSSNLPLLVINTAGQEIVDEPRIIAQLGIIDNGPTARNHLTDDFNGYDGQISIEIRGASSQFFPKNNFSFETQNADGSNNNVALLGMPEENDWVLHGPYSDKSLMRNMFTYDLASSMGRYAPRVRPVELFINGDYRGFYVLTERVKRDNNRVDIAKLTPIDVTGDELTGGYLLQIDRDAEDIDDGWQSNYFPWNFYAFDDPSYDELMPQQAAYIQNYMEGFEQAMNAPSHVQTYTDFIDEDSAIDYIIATEITKHIDAYRLSFFMYKTKDSDGGKLHLGPIWDINLGYGNFDYGCDNSPVGWAYDWLTTDCAFIAFWVPKLAKIPAFQHKMHCRWEELREEVLSTETLMHYIDSLALVLEEAQVRNFQRWEVLGEYVWPNAFVGNSYQHEINFLKGWITNRLAWMDANMGGDCSLVNNLTVTEVSPKITIFPNPFEEAFSINISDNNGRLDEIKVRNILGQSILRNKISDLETTTIATKNWQDGIYFVEFYAEGQYIKTLKINKI